MAKCLQFNHYGRTSGKLQTPLLEEPWSQFQAPVPPQRRKLEMVLIPHRLALLPAQPVTNKLVWNAQEPRGGGDVASRLF